jgi:hypothetical protein
LAIFHGLYLYAYSVWRCLIVHQFVASHLSKCAKPVFSWSHWREGYSRKKKFFYPWAGGVFAQWKNPAIPAGYVRNPSAEMRMMLFRNGIFSAEGPWQRYGAALFYIDP